MINAGILKRDGDRVLKFHDHNRRYYQLSPTQHPISGRWRFNIRIKRHRSRTIYRNRLFWMFEHRAVPGEYDVDHIDRDNTNDDPDNLQLREPGDNRSENWSPAAERELDDFFTAKINGSDGDF